MGDRPNTGSLYRADLLWCLSVIEEDHYQVIASLLGFAEDKPVVKEVEKEQHLALPERKKKEAEYLPPIITTNKATTPSYYRIIDRKIDPNKIAKAEDKPNYPDWFNKATTINFDDDKTYIPAMHLVKPVYSPLVPWSRLWPMLMRIMGADVPCSKPDINKLVEKVCQGQKIHAIPKRTRYTWAESSRLLIDINENNFPYRQDFLRLHERLLAWRGKEGLTVQFVHDEPGSYICHYQSGTQTIEYWSNPEYGTPLLILSDLGSIGKSRRSLYQWLAFGEQLKVNGIRATVLMPVAEREIDQRFLHYFDCIVWDGNSNLKPVQSQGLLEQKLSINSTGTKQLLALLFPALRVELGLLRAIRQLFPELDVSHESAIWQHAAINSVGDEWGWQANSRALYQEIFRSEFVKLPKNLQQQILDLIGIYHAQLPDEIYFEAMHQFIRLCLDVPEQIKTATLAYMSMLVKTYAEHMELTGLNLWVKRFLERHDSVELLSEHQLALLALERRNRPASVSTVNSWPDYIDIDQILPFLTPAAIPNFIYICQNGMALEIHDRLPQDDWGTIAVILLKTIVSTNPFSLSYPTTDGKRKYTLNRNTDLPFRFSLPLGKHNIEIAEHTLSIEVQSVGDKPSWVYNWGVDNDGFFIETISREGNHYRWYWHPPECGGDVDVFVKETDNSLILVHNQTDIKPGFWYFLPKLDAYNVPADWPYALYRDQYGLYVDVDIAGVTQRFRWIQPGSFLMGSPEAETGRDRNETQHPVILSQGYWLADTACTQALWQAVMGKNPSQFKGETLPVENISWDDVQEFLRIINQQTPYLNLHLPSEAEWEYACRAGSAGAFNFDEVLDLAKVNYRGTWENEINEWGEGALKQTAMVKSYPANVWGLYEMHGNVWEWCQDWHDSYPKESVTDPQGSETGTYRVLRGGSWKRGGELCRSALRGYLPSDTNNRNIGFRLVRGHQDDFGRSQHAGKTQITVMGSGFRSSGVFSNL